MLILVVATGTATNASVKRWKITDIERKSLSFMASSLRDEPASAALRVRATRTVCTHSTTAAQDWTEGSRVSARRAASPRHQRGQEAGGRPQARVGPARARGPPHLRLHRHLATKGSAKAVDTRASVSWYSFALRASYIYMPKISRNANSVLESANPCRTDVSEKYMNLQQYF